MKWYVYYNHGSCNDGDHDNGLEVFDTEEEARNWLRKQSKTRWSWNPTWVLLQGEQKDQS